MSLERFTFLAMLCAVVSFALLAVAIVAYQTFGVWGAAVAVSIMWGYSNAEKLDARMQRKDKP